MIRIAVKCKTESQRLVHYLVTTPVVDDAIRRAVERWNREEKIHPQCEAEVYEVLELNSTLIGCWKLDNSVRGND